MKIAMKLYRKQTLCYLISAVVSVPVFADISVTGKYGISGESDVDPVIRNNPTDIFDDVTYGPGVLPTLSSSVSVNTTGDIDDLSDGAIGTGARVDIVNSPADNGSPATLTWDLNLSDAALGFNLEELRVMSRANSAVAFQSYDLEVKYLGDLDFTKLNTDTIVYPETERGTSKSSTVFGGDLVYVETIVSAETGTYFATGVEEVRLTIYPVGKNFFKNPGDFTTLPESFYGTSFTNVDMIGSATGIPEPSAYGLLSGIVIVPLLCMRRRRR